MKTRKTNLVLLAAVVIFFLGKLYLNSFLMAENGDTYDFFKVARAFREGNFLIENKRMPLLSMLLAFAPPSQFVIWGRIVMTTFYLGCIGLFYRLAKFYLKSPRPALLATAVFTTNIVILDNSFYIMADTMFLFWFLLFFYHIKTAPKLNYKIVAIICTLALYTRLEGFILFAIATFCLCIKKYYLETIKLFFISTLLITPLLLKNYWLYQNVLYSPYLVDQAGFILTFESLFSSMAVILFGLGGIWFVPLLLTEWRFISRIATFIGIETISFTLFMVGLGLWGPFLRLYSIPITLLIIFIFKLLSDYKPPLTIKNCIPSIISLCVCAGLYYFTVNVLDQKDFGLLKYSKAFALIGSTIAVGMLLLQGRLNIKKGSALAIFSLLVISINLIIFAERFNIVRYKYFTIVQAVEYYQQHLVTTGSLGYLDESGVESWYLNDPNNKYSFVDTQNTYHNWIKQNNITYIIYTQELGNQIKKVTNLGEIFDTYEKVVAFESPFWGGKTKILKVRAD